MKLTKAKLIRLQRGESQSDIAAKLGSCRKTMNLFENGGLNLDNIRYGFIKAVEAHYGASVEELVSQPGQM